MHGPRAEHPRRAAVRLPHGHLRLARGEWPQDEPVRWLAGSVLGLLGLGGIGRAVAHLARPLGMRVHAINRSGVAGGTVEWAGTLADLDALLAAVDALVVALPLTDATRGLIGGPELARMKPHAVLVNVARGPIIDEAALVEHLRNHPGFSAGIDAWWDEPSAPGDRFAPSHPLLDLPNVLGSPHNSALAPGAVETAIRRAAENVARFLRGEELRGVVEF